MRNQSNVDAQNIMPTGRCFDDALDLIVERVREDRNSMPYLTLVHAIVLSQPEWKFPNVPYAHAWVEEMGYCWDSGLLGGTRIYYSVLQAEYYEFKRPQKTSKYSFEQAIMLNHRHGNYGPWRKEYIELCGLGGKIMGAAKIDYEGPKSGSAGLVKGTALPEK